MVVATCIVAAFAVIAAIIAFFRIYQTLFKLNPNNNDSVAHSSVMVELGVPEEEGRNEFSLAEIKQATKDFYDGLYISEDIYGPLYIGLIPNTYIYMMIKTLTLAIYPRFLDEVKYMSKIRRHRNVVNVLGYCCENGHQMIVYEYLGDFMTLREYLQNYIHVTFERMVFIALEAAKGLQYLHNLTPPLAHNDFSAAKVLIGANFVAKVSDAGMSRLLDLELGQEDIPSFDETGDVFSFGLMLLEMLTGEELIELTSAEDLFEWIDSRICSNTLLDSRILQGTHTMEALLSFMMVMLNCLWFPYTRPKMIEVVTKLEEILTVECQSIRITLPTHLFN